MGSTGNHNFGDYKPGTATKCDSSIDTALEDVARAAFYQKHGKVPPVGTLVRVRKGMVSGRLVVEDASKLVIGNLPTKYHYLLLCMDKDYEYEGEVSSSKAGKLPVVEVHLDPV